MAFTVAASWDFRGSDSAATKRAPRIGAWDSLTELGAPSYDTNGVTLAATGDGLYLTLPAGLKFTSNFSLIMRCRRLGSQAGGADSAGWIGYIVNEPLSGASYHTALFSQVDSFDLLMGVYADNTTISTVGGGARPGVGVDVQVCVAQESTTTFAGYVDGSSRWSVARTFPSYTSTSYLMIGSGRWDTRQPNLRVAYALITDGVPNTSELADITANPNTYLYSASTPIAAISSGYHLHGTTR